ncbi:MAG: DNA primase [Oscillospiraceae bacterium]|jgi:DNA primase|nr:DNA primase [Oscillospiraceae bacterium]
MAIPRSFIDDLIERSSIESVVGDYVQLKRQGGDLWGLCPFHNEKSASFHVTPERRQYHCFGCGKGGGVVNFVMEIENIGFVDAIHYLAKRIGVTVPDDGESAEASHNRRRTLELLTESARFFHEQLKASHAAMQYLEKRRIQWKTAVRFGLGYAPEGWGALTDEMRRRGYSDLELSLAGLTVKGRNGGLRDKFYNRLMFPVIDQKGQVIAFGGRVIGDGEPKYLNSPEIPNVFSKRRVLYGVNLARNTKRGFFILCEGNVDVVSLHQAGFDNAVASMGTSLTHEQIALIAQLKIPEVVVCYDADNAGVKATDRALDELAKSNIKLSVVNVTGGKDVDDFLKASVDSSAQFEGLLESRKDDVNYRLDRLTSEFDLSLDDQRVAYLRKAIELLATFDAVKREVASRKVAQTAGVAPDFVSSETAKAAERLRRNSLRNHEREVTQPVRTFNEVARRTGLRYSNPKSAAGEEGIIRVLTLDQSLIASLPIAPSEFSSPELARILTAILERGDASIASLQSTLSPEDMAIMARISEQEENLANSGQILADYIAAVRRERMLQSGDILNLVAAKKELLG